MTERHGDWMCTYTGRQFWPLDPRAEDVDIMDIAHALSNLCRFAGHCLKFYSVAQHSVLVSDLCPPKDMLWALLHDAPEAYLVDIPRPIKNQPAMAPYRLAEAVLMTKILERFGISDQGFPESVREADERMLATEARDIMFTAIHPWNLSAIPLNDAGGTLAHCWSPSYAKARFIERFDALMA